MIKNKFFAQKFDSNKIGLMILLCLFILTLSSCARREERHESSVADPQSYVDTIYSKGSFQFVKSRDVAIICVDSSDYPGVFRAAKDLQADVNRVTGRSPIITQEENKLGRNTVIIGTIGKSKIIDRLIQSGKINVEQIAGKWESFIIEVVPNPLPGIKNALIIAGSDKRGTIYGIYDVSKQIGVSPWYWWADVPVEYKNSIFIKAGRYIQGPPAVKYRGIFINNEAPAFSGWAWEKFGGFNHKVYEHVFELILRLRGNYLWPAMWGNAFYVNDPLNPKLADEYGIVIGTSHHEPMMRAHAEWKKFGSGAWNYETNEDKLKEFWTEGVKRMDSYESVVTVGMRGDGDEPMSEENNIALLERIIADQRKIIEEVTGKKAEATPQMWALYKEVQDYYDKGMRVPDDVMLLLCNDNWGNIRKLPKLDDKPRAGGYGIYYHFDYVGGPRNYKWLNTNPISRIWEQMNLAYRYGAKELWLVNVGDIKPMEFPISFFLDFAWDPEKITADDLQEYTRDWTKKQFGEKYADDIADIISKYTKYNARRKPELLSPETYSLANYREAGTVVYEYNELAKNAEEIYGKIPLEYKDAYYQLVLYPVKACANLNELYFTVAKNRLYAQQLRTSTNELAQKARELFKKDADLSNYYNRIMSGGKWNHMMDQVHIGYTYWQQPVSNIMPEVIEIENPPIAIMGVALESSEDFWSTFDVPGTEEKGEAVLPEFDAYNQQIFCIDIFNRGQVAFNYKIISEEPWLLIEPNEGRIEKQQDRILVSVDWKKAPVGKRKTPITITGPDGKNIIVSAVVNNPEYPKRKQIKGFVESNGYVAIEAGNYSKAIGGESVEWKVIPDLGRTSSAITTFPVTAESQMPGGKSPHLEYRMYLFTGGEAKVNVYLSPTLNFHDKGLRYAISFNDEEPQIINIHEDTSYSNWAKWVSNNIIISASKHPINNPGEHTLKFWFVDSGVVLQKIVIDTGGLKPSYLGAPESFYKP